MVASRGARSGWKRRSFLSASLRVAATLVPVLVSFGVALALHRVLPASSGTTMAIGRSLGLAACSLGALVVTDALARRFLPLAALLQLSLVFPDQTPSRFKTALKSGSGRRLVREVDLARREGISDEPSRAAEQLLMLATAMGDHDRRTRGHSERVRLYTELIAEELHISEDERSKLQWAALIHDIGKIEVAPEILNKKGVPDTKEWLILRSHPLIGERLAAPVEPWLGDAVLAVGGHHERWDGTGYPRGLAGAAIPRAAAIVAVADAFEVMTAVRSYKPAMPLAEARAELTRCAGTHFSPEVVRALLSVSIGRLRRSMGVLAALAHMPFLSHATKVAAYAPDTVSTAVGFTTSTATAGAGVLALTGALAVASPPPFDEDSASAATSSGASVEVPMYVEQALLGATGSSLPEAPAVEPTTTSTTVSAAIAPSDWITSEHQLSLGGTSDEPPAPTTSVPAPPTTMTEEDKAKEDKAKEDQAKEDQAAQSAQDQAAQDQAAQFAQDQAAQSAQDQAAEDSRGHDDDDDGGDSDDDGGESGSGSDDDDDDDGDSGNEDDDDGGDDDDDDDDD